VAVFIRGELLSLDKVLGLRGGGTCDWSAVQTLIRPCVPWFVASGFGPVIFGMVRGGGLAQACQLTRFYGTGEWIGFHGYGIRFFQKANLVNVSATPLQIINS